MTDKAEYDALKKCIPDGMNCAHCEIDKCKQSVQHVVSRLLTLHGEMVAREIWEDAGCKTLKDMLDIARKVFVK